MSIDETVTQDLLETLVDGQEGFEKGAQKLADSDQAELAATFRRYSAQRQQFADELRELAREYGDAVDSSGSVAATFHRGWMAIKDAVSGSDPSGVLDAAEQGEDHAVEEYTSALAQELSPTLRTAVERQATAIREAHDDVRRLRDSHS